MPLFGAKKNAIKNIMVETKTITGPEAKLYVLLKKSPTMAASAPRLAAKNIILDNFCVIKNAVAAGVINMATTKITPTVCKEATVTSVSKIISR
jgi:hypothetical protein